MIESYGSLLSRVWSQKLNDYFLTDWSHLCLSWKGKPNMIKVELEGHMKYAITNLDDPNEPIMLSQYALHNYYFDSYFDNYTSEISLVT